MSEPKKGERDGLCNRRACQAPLAGQEQWVMGPPFTSGEKLHYCAKCAQQFIEDDRKFGDPIRVTLVED
jgi:hypothetical protein